MSHPRFVRNTLLGPEEQPAQTTAGSPNKEWTRSETLALALQSCTFCYGLGLRPGRAGNSAPCNCVFRAIFRACYDKFRYCASRERHISRVSLESNPGCNRKAVWGLKDEEFTADFCLVSRRTLSPREHRIFRCHFLLGADWKLCCRKLNMDRGAFFHEIYRIEQKLGRTFRDLKPYALFPVDEYFGCSRRVLAKPSQIPEVLTDQGVDDEPVDYLNRRESELLNIRRVGRPRKLRFPLGAVALGA